LANLLQDAPQTAPKPHEPVNQDFERESEPVQSDYHDFEMDHDNPDEEEMIDLEDVIEEPLKERVDEEIIEESLVIDNEQSIAGLKLDLGLQLDMKDERLQGLTYAFKLVMMELVKKPQWTWSEFAEYCQENHTAPKVVFERLNQWSNQKYQEFILRREKDHLVVNRQLLQK